MNFFHVNERQWMLGEDSIPSEIIHAILPMIDSTVFKDIKGDTINGESFDNIDFISMELPGFTEMRSLMSLSGIL